MKDGVREPEVVSVSRWYRLMLCGQPILVPADFGCELIESGPVRGLPNSPLWYIGVMAVRGRIVPVFDLELWAEPSVGRKSAARVLVLGQPPSCAAIPVTTYPSVVRAAPEPVDPLARLPTGNRVVDALHPCLQSHLLSVRIYLERPHFELDLDGLLREVAHSATPTSAKLENPIGGRSM